STRIHLAHLLFNQYQIDVAAYSGTADAKESWRVIRTALPKIEKEAVASGLEPLQRILSSFSFLEHEITISSDLEIAYGGRPYRLMSDSEQYRMSIIMHLAVVEMFNFPFVLIDRGDIVITPDFKANLLSDLRAIAATRPVIYSQAKTEVEIAKVVESISAAGILDMGVVRMAGGLAEVLV
ncbi:unnamed protein product, partial [marine sediment metagenome]